MILQNYTHDFHSLVEWFRLKWEYEHTDPPQRPNFLAWEIRGASPRKVNHFCLHLTCISTYVFSLRSIFICISVFLVTNRQYIMYDNRCIRMYIRVTNRPVFSHNDQYLTWIDLKIWFRV